AILISTSARYSLLAMKIPCASEIQWTYAGELIKFYPDGTMEPEISSTTNPPI
ncbi:Hypothetical protein FKW44_002551, partial [Caligus rogercresseyi]